MADESEHYQYLEKENGIRLDLSQSQADKLESLDEVDFLEKDMEVEGSAEDSVNASECENEWNINMVNGDVEENTAQKERNPVKVAIIDSGIDYTNGIPVAMRKDFITDGDPINILYEDSSGHGTSIAGVIAASGEENEEIVGIAPNVELYSAKVLNAENKAPVSRVAEGIYWAMDQDVDIINLSFGITQSSELLEKAIQDASAKGILLIASAGNNGQAGVEYPAAYKEVMAVASVNSEGKHSEWSAVGDEIEIAAPGEKVKTASCFDGEIVSSGTSIASPHVAAVAARLWALDKTKSSQFIRGLLDVSANSVGTKEEYGYGIVDLSYAMEIYEEYAKNYVEEENVEMVEHIPENNADIQTCENDYVEGRWEKPRHEELAAMGTITGNDLKVLKWGAVVADHRIAFKGTKGHPHYHGYGYGKNLDLNDTKKTNYISCYILLTKMARRFYNQNTYVSPATVPGLSLYDYDLMCGSIDDKGMRGTSYETDENENIISRENINYTWEYMLTNNKVNPQEKYAVTNHNKALLLYGMALHTATDTFAHSAFVDGKQILHTINYENNADNINNISNRYDCAKVVARNLLVHVAIGEKGFDTDWIIPSNVYNNTYKLVCFSEFANATKTGTYSEYKTNFDNMNINISDIK